MERERAGGREGKGGKEEGKDKRMKREPRARIMLSADQLPDTQ